MNSTFAVLLISGMCVLSSISQIMLKKSADKSYSVWWRKFLNTQVVAAYTLFFGAIFVNMFAMRYIDYKLMPVLETLTYVFVVGFSRFFLAEKLDCKKQLGAFLILSGIFIFNL